MPEPLKVDPAELRLFAGRLDSHASDFSSAHQKAHAGASQVVLGSGLAGAALPEMLAAWETDGARFGKHFGAHAGDHRQAANGYERTDGNSAGRISDAGSGL